ncbi:purine and uridine phosphorylase [Aaosphaeria arxii CBS 175.79]|uniref:Purine and uridine phosphorylase n=1 Tax=Aaosphaeria arxii CBS 175.79 TaxID=1450172 RepID=A0A6A5XMQ5_9PLEO|nr:purine and uridine phosphorylase [Aaosphaeria arxii CBS 175.79]KAF2014091.1 purine and uridine phosphorylase [Aaosphaeria arxii CBS 175.79]
MNPRNLLSSITNMAKDGSTDERTKLNTSDYDVAWICPLPDVELPSSRFMFDEVHLTPNYDASQDSNQYYCGKIAGHNVVMATLPLGYSGYHHAARLSSALFNTFSNIRTSLIVGIGGGVPLPQPCDNPLQDIHLGDVVVGWSRDGKSACVHYGWNRDRGNTEPEILGTMEKGDWNLGQGLAKLASDHERGETNFQDHLRRLENAPGFAHPGLEYDRLFRDSVEHRGEYGSSCENCIRNPFALVARPPRTSVPKDDIIFHLGKIASGNSVIQNGKRRDKISQICGGVLCVEMEAVGVDVNRKYLVVRGISDYADSH